MLTIKKIWKLAALSLAALAAVYSCSNDEFEASLPQGKITISAGFEQPSAMTRTAVDGSNQVVWLENDAFKLFYTDGGIQKANVFTTAVTNKPTTATFTGEALPSSAVPSYAVYPSAEDITISENVLTMTLPSSIDGGDASNGPMLANASSGYSSLSFKHLCGLLKLTVTNLPAEAKKFVITADKYIAGTAKASLSENEPYLEMDQGAQGNSKSITVTIADGQKTFYIPIPVATNGTYYTTLKAEVTKEDGSSVGEYQPKEWTNVEVKRAALLHATFGFQMTVDASTEISNALSNSLPQTSPTEETSTSVLVTGTVDATATNATNAEIKIPVVKNSNVELNFENVPSATQAAPLKVTDNTTSAGTGESAETSMNVTTIAIPPLSGASAPSLEITTPNSTTELATTNQGESTTFDVVTALTAKNTLVVSNNVIVNKLIVRGGNVRINKNAKVSVIEKSENNSEKTIIYIETGADYPSGLSSDDFELRNADIDEVLQNGGTLTLIDDLTLTEPMVVKSGATVTLNLNGHTIKNNTDIWNEAVGHWSLISVQGGKLTITGEGQMIAKENDCYAVDVREEGEVTIENGFFNGNIAALYVYLGKAYIKGGKFAVQQKDNQYPNGNTFLLNIYDKNRDRSLIEVTGGTFVGVNPGDTNAEGPNTNFIKIGYHAEEAEESTSELPVYKVVKD